MPGLAETAFPYYIPNEVAPLPERIVLPQWTHEDDICRKGDCVLCHMRTRGRSIHFYWRQFWSCMESTQPLRWRASGFPMTMPDKCFCTHSGAPDPLDPSFNRSWIVFVWSKDVPEPESLGCIPNRKNCEIEWAPHWAAKYIVPKVPCLDGQITGSASKGPRLKLVKHMCVVSGVTGAHEDCWECGSFPGVYCKAMGTGYFCTMGCRDLYHERHAGAEWIDHGSRPVMRQYTHSSDPCTDAAEPEETFSPTVAAQILNAEAAMRSKFDARRAEADRDSITDDRNLGARSEADAMPRAPTSPSRASAWDAYPPSATWSHWHSWGWVSKARGQWEWNRVYGGQGRDDPQVPWRPEEQK